MISDAYKWGNDMLLRSVLLKFLKSLQVKSELSFADTVL